MKKLLTLLTILASFTFASAADFLSFQLASTTLSNGYVLQTNGRNSVWVATSSLGIISGLTNAYASSTFVSFPYATSTFPSFGYGSSTYALLSSLASYVTFPYASSTFPSFAYATSTFVSFPYATSTFSTYSYGSTTYAVGGSNTQVQFNDSGVFGGDNGFTWTKATNILGLGVEGGQTTIQAANAVTADTNGTDITIQAGAKTGTGIIGGIYLFDGAGMGLESDEDGFAIFAGGTRAAFLSTASLASTDKTFTFPNTTGTFCLTITCTTVDYASSTFVNFPYATSTFTPRSYASSTFVSFPYATSTFSTYAYGTSTYASTTGLVSYYVPYTGATGNVNLGSNNISFANGSTTNLSASTGIFGGGLNITGTTFLQGNASTSKLSAGGFTFANGIATGTLDVVGKFTGTTASTTQLSASTGLFGAALNISGTSFLQGNASTSNISGTGMTFTSAFFTNATTTRLESTTASTTDFLARQATSTNFNLTGWFRDSVNATGTAGQLLASTGTSTLWTTVSSSGVTNAYASSTFVSFPYASSTYYTLFQSLSTLNITATGTLAVTGNASTTKLSTWGFTAGNINATGTLDVTGKTTLGIASTTQLSASTGIFAAALNVSGTSFLQGNASTSKLSAGGLTFASGIATGTLDVVGTSTLATTTVARWIAVGTTTPSSWGNVGIANSQETATIVSGTTTTGLSIWGNVNDFFQNVITNLGQGINTEAGLTVQNASSTGSSFFGWFGINGPRFSTTTTTYSTGAANDVTLISEANDFYITNANVTGKTYFQTGGVGVSTASTTRLTLDSFGWLGMGTTTPNNRLDVATGSIRVAAFLWTPTAKATSTSMTVDWKDGNKQTLQMSTSAYTIVFKNSTSSPGAQLGLMLCNPPTGTPGAPTFTHVSWNGNTAPTQVTTNNKCTKYSFSAEYSTSTNVIVIGAGGGDY